MAASVRLCDIDGCKRPSRAICMCCQKYLCRDHLKEHDEAITAQLPELADRVNAVSDQLNRTTSGDATYLTGLNQWRDNAHRAVDQYYERKHQQLEQTVREKTNHERQKLDQIRANVSSFLQNDEATKQQVDSLSSSIRAIERNVNNLQASNINFNPLVIDDNLINVRQDASLQDYLNPPPPYEMMDATSGGSAFATGNNTHQGHTRRNRGSHDRTTRWDIEQQAPGMTDMMRVNILNIVGTTLDTYGTANPQRTAADVQSWLDSTYGRSWNVEIRNVQNRQSYDFPPRSIYLVVTDARSGWTVFMYK